MILKQWYYTKELEQLPRREFISSEPDETTGETYVELEVKEFIAKELTDGGDFPQPVSPGAGPDLL